VNRWLCLRDGAEGAEDVVDILIGVRDYVHGEGIRVFALRVLKLHLVVTEVARGMDAAGHDTDIRGSAGKGALVPEGIDDLLHAHVLKGKRGNKKTHHS